MAEKMRSGALLRWLTILAWLLLALGYLVFFVTDLRLDFAQLQVPCSGEGCNYLALAPAEFEALIARGISPRAYAWIMTGANVLALAASWALGAFILWRQGASRIGWAVSLALIVIPVTFISDADNLVANNSSVYVLSTILWGLGVLVLLLFLYLFPNGRLYPRWAFAVLSATYLISLVDGLVASGSISLPAWDRTLAASLVVGLFLVAGGFQVLRYRRVSSALERQQTKWILLGISLLLLAPPIWVLLFYGGLDIPSGMPRLLAIMAGWIAGLILITALPVTMAIAILRYRLWDIDLVIRRTLVYFVLTGVLGMIYFGSVIGLQSLLGGLTGEEQPLVIVASTLLIAALFAPVRSRAQLLIDRAFYRRKYDAAKTLADFAASARDETDLERLSDRLTGVVDVTMRPAHVGLWLRSPAASGGASAGRASSR